jgi:hypothetical protein
MSKLRRQDLSVAKPIDDRDEEDPAFSVQDEFSSTNTDFGGPDPAAEDETKAVTASEKATFSHEA